jgi:hypothetical protein
MLTTSRALSSLIEEYVSTLDSSDGEYRLIVPGLTPRIAEEVQHLVRKKQLRSYIVADGDPDEAKRRLPPVSLTTMRYGSFIAIAEPGALADIRDSIRGSGGAVRSVAFSEEWPWISATNESFDFKARFVPELLRMWDPAPEARKWLEAFIGQALLKAMVGDSARAELLFEEILGCFSPVKGSSARDMREQFLMHCGIPKPPQIDKDALAVSSDTTTLIKLVNARVLNEEGIRRSLHDNVSDDDTRKEETHDAIDAFVDGLRSVSALGNDLLALRNCWGDPDAKEKNWDLLNAAALRKLFELQEQTVELDSLFIADPSVICRGDRKQAAGFASNTFNIHVRFSIPADALTNSQCTIRISTRRQTLQSIDLGEPEGEVTVAFCPADRHISYKTRIPIKVSLLIGSVERVKETLSLHCCGDERPAFVLVTPIFKTEDLREPDAEEEQSPEHQITVDDAVKLHVFRAESDQPTISRGEDEEVMLTEQNNIWSTASTVDVLREPAARLTMHCRVRRRNAVLLLVAPDADLGEFTIEDELREVCVKEKREKVRRLLDVFTGKSTEPYGRLGGIDARSRRRIRYARLFEQRRGWQPVLTDLFASPEGTDESSGSYARKVGIVASAFLEGLDFPEHGRNLLSDYESQRDAFRQAVVVDALGHPVESQHPDYCIHPMYVVGASYGDLLLRYLQAYAKIQQYLQDRSNRLTWPQLFVLSHLDCLVHWRDDHSCNAFFLVGPWHPLVAAKRYLVQQALVRRAERLLAEKQSHFCSLIANMGQVAGFHWLPSVHRDHEALEPSYVSPTSDPGWHLAFSRRALETAQASSGDKTWLGEAIESLKTVLGVDVSIHLPSSGAMVGTALRSYAKSFPSRRHLSLFFPTGFSGLDEITAADEFLHTEDGPSSFGLQLTGGIGLSFAESPDVPDGVGWTNPPLKVFRYPSRVDCIQAQHPDLQFAEVNDRVEFIELSQSPQLPRGCADDSVFDCGLSRLKRGRSLVPQSALEEWDKGEGFAASPSVGESFAQCCALSCLSSGAPQAALFATSLPNRLDTTWTIVPGAVIDPAVFVRYVRDGHDRSLEERALWDYRVSLGKGAASYFIVSTIPAAFRSEVNGLFGDGIDHASRFVTELGEAGLAIAGEAMKSGRHALGAVGLVAAVRLLVGGHSYYGPLAWSQQSVGFVLPVDSFREVLQGNNQGDSDSGNDTSRKRADLLAVLIKCSTDSREPLQITSVAFECKFTLGTFPDSEVEGALTQARATAQTFNSLCNTAKLASGIPERLALVKLIRFGLRAISGKYSDENAEPLRELEATIYRKILAAEFEIGTAANSACLVSSEMGLAGSAECSNRLSGLWVRLNRSNWPDVTDSESVMEARQAVSGLFGLQSGRWDEASDQSAGNETRASLGEAEMGSSAPSDQIASPTTEECVASEGDGSLSDQQSVAHELGSVGGAQSRPSSPEGINLHPVKVGVDSSRTSHYFDPHSPTDRLDNVNVMVTGSSGKGKTQFLKYLICSAREQGASVLVLDFKNDFVSDADFIEHAGLDAIVVTFDGLPFNPLIPFPVVDSRTGQSFFQCAQHIEGIAALLRRTYGGGDQQQADVKNAIRLAFSEVGVDPLSSTTAYDSSVVFPDFARVGELLEQANRKAYNRLDPLFTLGIFKPKFAQTSFASMVGRSLAVDLSQITSDPLKNTLAELIVLSAHSYYNSQKHCGDLRQMFVIDEAHRILQADYLQRFALECRAYGLSLILSSQYPSHFPTDISASMATKVIHGNGRDLARVREICSLLGCSGREAEVAELGMFEAVYANKHARNSFIRTITYPHYIVLQELRRKGRISVDEVSSISGVDTAKQSALSIIKHLEKLGVCELREGFVVLLSN